MVYFNILSIIVVMMLLFFKFKKSNFKFDNFVMKNYKLIVCLLFGIIIFTSFYKLDEVPASIHIDEAGMAYDALALSTDGVDRYLNKYPIYFINFGGGQSVMMGYLVSILVTIFEFSLFIIRIPGVIFKIVLITLGFFLIKDKRKSLLFLFLLAINPYFIMQSRFGLDCNLMVGFLTIASFLLHHSITGNKSFILPGIFFGLTLYTYALSFIVIPIYLVMICGYLLYIKKINLKKLISFGIPVFLFAIPLILMILVNSGIINEINSFITIPAMTSYRGSEISFDNVFLNLYILPSILTFDNSFVFGNLLTYNSSYEFGTIYYMAIPFFIIGCYEVCKNIKLKIVKREYSLDVLMMIWFLSVLICQLLIVQPNINKANAIMFPVVYFVFVGLYKMFKLKSQIIVPIICLFVINFVCFNIFYFEHHTTRANDYDLFYTDFYEALEFSNTLDEDLFYVEGSPIYSNLLLKTSPYDYSNEVVKGKTSTHIYKTDVVDLEAGYVIHRDNAIIKELEQLDYSVKSFGNYRVYYRTIAKVYIQ